jgi:hypothetical protein
MASIHELSEAVVKRAAFHYWVDLPSGNYRWLTEGCLGWCCCILSYLRMVADCVCWFGTMLMLQGRWCSVVDHRKAWKPLEAEERWGTVAALRGSSKLQAAEM